ncbi:MAG: 30S ribosomal protein S18 [Planctomycetota bacterium]
MKHYEGMFILHNGEPAEGEVAVAPEDVVRALVEKSAGQVAHSLVWANRKLAYTIAGRQTATYVLAYFSGEQETCNKLNREVAISDRCLRHAAFAIHELPAAEALPGPLTEPTTRLARRADDGSEGDLAAVAEAALAEDGMPSEEKEKKLHESLDYKNVYVLRRLITSQGKLYSRVRSNLHAKHQRQLRQAVLRARVLALLPFVAR